MNEWEKRMILQFQLIKGIADDRKILIWDFNMPNNPRDNSIPKMPNKS